MTVKVAINGFVEVGSIKAAIYMSLRLYDRARGFAAAIPQRDTLTTTPSTLLYLTSRSMDGARHSLLSAPASVRRRISPNAETLTQSTTIAMWRLLGDFPSSFQRRSELPPTPPTSIRHRISRASTAYRSESKRLK